MQVYCITNKKNGKKYIGKTIALAARRWSNHKASAKRGKKSHFCDALRRYGSDALNSQFLLNLLLLKS